MSVVQEIDAHAANATDVLVEVNIGGEESKSGVALAELDAFLEAAAACPKARVRRPHDMPPLSDDAEESAPVVRRAARTGLAHGFRQQSRGHADFRPPSRKGATYEVRRPGPALPLTGRCRAETCRSRPAKG